MPLLFGENVHVTYSPKICQTLGTWITVAAVTLGLALLDLRSWIC
jgi:hypothetical protein